MLKARWYGTWMVLVLAACITADQILAAPPSGGGGGSKVSVTAANPADAFQGEELDVIVSGSGFDQGSQVSYLVTGTTDGSQVEVLSVDFISSSELKTRVRPRDAALPSEYDIEVRTTSGRKGKGTTLFRVKQAAESCVDTDFPTIAFAERATFASKKGRQGKNQDPITYNLILTGDNGCERHTLLAAYPESFGSLRFVVRDGIGLVAWEERTDPDELDRYTMFIKGMLMDVSPGGGVTANQTAPSVLHELWIDGTDVRWAAITDVTFSSNGWPTLALMRRSLAHVWTHEVIDLETGSTEVILNGTVHLSDSQGNPYVLRGAGMSGRWSPSADALYIVAERTDAQYVNPGIARIARFNGIWQPPELIVVNHQDGDYGIHNAGLSPDGRLAYSYPLHDGPHTWLNTGIIDPDLCVPVECDVLDGAPSPGVIRDAAPLVWMTSGSLLFRRTGDLGEWRDPDLGIESGLSIDEVETDSSL